MACPYRLDCVGLESEESQRGENILNKGGNIDYTTYLQLGPLLNCQKPASDNGKSTMAHDELLFIVTHQTYELWFKEILFELDSIRDLFLAPMMDESKTLLITRRLNRITIILKILVDQFAILETMTPHDFKEFRHHLAGSSGFQSLQFRLLENKLGIQQERRIKYNQQPYQAEFTAEEHKNLLDCSINEPSLLELVESWLERTPGLDANFNFWEKYSTGALQWINDIFLKPAEEEKDPVERKTKMDDYKKQKEAYDSITDTEQYNKSLMRGERHLSHKAFQGAMMISLYQDEPRFHQPFQILNLLMDIDSLMMKWRYTHVMLVQRMIGSKSGIGGSSGYLYLRSTVSDRYKVFVDLFNLSTYLIPRQVLPPLTNAMKRRLAISDFSQLNSNTSLTSLENVVEENFHIAE